MSQAQRPPPPGSMVLKSNPSIILLCSFLPSDYIIEEKTAVLQKREHEGFGFVLRGAKGKGCFFRSGLGLGLGGHLLLASAVAQDPQCFGVSAGTVPSCSGGRAARARLSSGAVRGAEDAVQGSRASLALSGLFL